MNFMKFLKERKVFLILTLAVVIIGIVFVSFLMRNGGFFASLPSQNEGVNTSIESPGSPGRSLSPKTSAPDYQYNVNDEEKGYYAPAPVSSTGSESFESKIIKRANASITVKQNEFLKAFNGIQSLSKTYEGYVKNSSYHTFKNEVNGTIDVMVPTNKLDDFLNELNKFGKVNSINVSSDDVSGEYVDLSSRLNVLSSQRDLLLSWLNKTKNIGEMLQIRSQLEQVETQIETIKGRMKYIDFHSSYAEVYIDINRNENPPSLIGSYFNNLLRRAGSGVAYSFGFLLILIAWLIPYLLIVFIVYLVWKKRRKE